MIAERWKRLSGNSALRPALVIWGFGYALVELFAALQDRSAPGAITLSSVPLFITGVGLTVALDALRRRLWDRPGPLRIALIALAVAAATVAQTMFDLHLLRWLSLTVFPDWQPWAAVITKQRLFQVMLLYLWTFGLALTVLWAARIGDAARISDARALSFEAATHRAEAAALRLQLNPHFLFNTLNSIASLVTVDRKADAEEMIGRLADFLRASLVADPMADVGLADEIETIDAYLAIESARFGERMRVEIDVAPGVSEAQVPNFILQPLVENAVKHGVAATRGPAVIAVTAARSGDDLVLGVVNHAGAGGPATDRVAWPARTGIGIANIRQRLAVAYGDRAALDTEALADGYRATIRLPFVTR